jgi:hypothetical protein
LYASSTQLKYAIKDGRLEGQSWIGALVLVEVLHLIKRGCVPCC